MITENLNKFLNSFWADCRKFIICTLVFLILLAARDKYLYKKVNKTEKNIFILQTFIGEKYGLAWTNLSALTFFDQQRGF